MLAIAFRFPGGRYHATPWGRHVNEAEVAWPPEPWRICRALLAIWHRRLAADPSDRNPMRGLLEALADKAPVFWLPPVVQSHVRHYMRIREGKGEKPTLVFDGFLRLDAEAELVVAWPEAILERDDLKLLDRLLEELPYLGRAESWVEARRLADWNGKANCVPASTEPILDQIEPVEVLLPERPGDYSMRREELLGREWPGKSKADSRRNLEQVRATLPADWLDALAVETSALQTAAWSDPPASRRVIYLRPRAHVAPPCSRKAPGDALSNTLRFALYGKPLPRIEDSLAIGELARLAVISRAGRHFGEDHVPTLLSGHGRDGMRAHDHAFFLPEDADNDGRLDHLTVHVPAGLPQEALRVVRGLERLWSRDGGDWRLFYEGTSTDQDKISPLEERSSCWVSVTPWLRPWHAKVGFGDLEQLARDCQRRGLPIPISCQVLDSITVGGRCLRPIQFTRFRKRRGLHQPDRQGRFLRLQFDQEIAGPLALGFGCHFGLGLFKADIGE